MGSNATMRKLGILFLFVLLLSSLKVYGVGISSPYLENDTIKLIKGQSTIYTINLQNPEDRDIDVKIDYNSKIAKIIDYKEVYTLPAGKLDTEVSFFINASEETEIGGIYAVSYSMKPLTAGGEGTLPMTVGVNKHFNVEIIKNPNSVDMRILLYYAAFIAVFIIIIIFIWKKSKR